MRFAFLLLFIVTTVLAADADPSTGQQPLKLGPFPNGLEYKPVPEPSNTGNPLLNSTKRSPRSPKSGKPRVGVLGGANNYGGAGAVKGTVGNF